jgi:hypothetical protein
MDTNQRMHQVGRPRKLDTASLARLAEWERNRVTLRALCRELGVSPATARRALRGPDYKSPPPDQRPPPRRRRMGVSRGGIVSTRTTGTLHMSTQRSVTWDE